MNTRVEAIDFSDSLDGLDRVSASFFLTGCDWESQAVDDDVVNPEVPICNESVNQSEAILTLSSLVRA